MTDENDIKVSDRSLLHSSAETDFLAFAMLCFMTLFPGKKFVVGPHIEAMAWHLEQCRLGNIRRLIITIAPRSLKSFMVSIAFPMWIWKHNPGAAILCASYGQELADQNAYLSREIMEADWFQKIAGNVKLSSKKFKVRNFMTTENGVRKSTSTDGPGTGFGGNYIIIDDPSNASDAHSPDRLKAAQNWFKTTVASRHDNPKEGCTILIQQRLNKDDLAGFLLELGGWTHLSLPAIADRHQAIQIDDDEFWIREPKDLLHPERLGADELSELRAIMGIPDFEAQYQQNPVIGNPRYLQKEWIKYYDLYE